MKKLSISNLQHAAPYALTFLIGYMAFTPSMAMAADGTSTIVTGLQNLSQKLMTIGTPIAALGFTGAAVTHSVSHDPQTQERAKTGMKAAGVGIAGALLGGAIVGMVASAFGG